MNNYLEIVNSPVLYLVVAILLTIISWQAFVYIKMALARAEEINIPKEKLVKAAKTAAITSIVPSIAIVIALITLAGVLGTPVSWGRLAVIGSLTYELFAASLGATASGTALGSASYGAQAFLTSVCTMTIGSFITIGLTIFTFKWYKKSLNNKLAKSGDNNWSKILVASIIISMYSRFMVDPLVQGGTSLITMLASAGAMVIIGIIIKKTGAKWLKDFAISFSMIFGMITAIIFSITI
jgi:hypothetical protein